MSWFSQSHRDAHHFPSSPPWRLSARARFEAASRNIHVVLDTEIMLDEALADPERCTGITFDRYTSLLVAQAHVLVSHPPSPPPVLRVPSPPFPDPEGFEAACDAFDIAVASEKGALQVIYAVENIESAAGMTFQRYTDLLVLQCRGQQPPPALQPLSTSLPEPAGLDAAGRGFHTAFADRVGVDKAVADGTTARTTSKRPYEMEVIADFVVTWNASKLSFTAMDDHESKIVKRQRTSEQGGAFETRQSDLLDRVYEAYMDLYLTGPLLENARREWEEGLMPAELPWQIYEYHNMAAAERKAHEAAFLAPPDQTEYLIPYVQLELQSNKHPEGPCRNSLCCALPYK